MTLKNARIGRAEYLSEETRKKYHLPPTGLIIIESINPDLHENMEAIGADGISGYLRKFGDFKNVEITE